VLGIFILEIPNTRLRHLFNIQIPELKLQISSSGKRRTTSYSWWNAKMCTI